MTVIKTDRLCLREMSEEDAPFLLKVLNEPAFIRNVGDRGVRTVAQAANYLRERVTSSYERFGFGSWLVELRDSHEPVGICGLIKRDTLEDVDLGFSFLERFWSRGYAFEAAAAVLTYTWTILKLPRLVAIVSSHNSASLRLLDKLGFSFEKNIRLPSSDSELMLLFLRRK